VRRAAPAGDGEGSREREEVANASGTEDEMHDGSSHRLACVVVAVYVQVCVVEMHTSEQQSLSLEHDCPPPAHVSPDQSGPTVTGPRLHASVALPPKVLPSCESCWRKPHVKTDGSQPPGDGVSSGPHGADEHVHAVLPGFRQHCPYEGHAATPLPPIWSMFGMIVHVHDEPVSAHTIPTQEHSWPVRLGSAQQRPPTAVAEHSGTCGWVVKRLSSSYCTGQVQSVVSPVQLRYQVGGSPM
jgi:hypothetical protein